MKLDFSTIGVVQDGANAGDRTFGGTVSEADECTGVAGWAEMCEQRLLVAHMLCCTTINYKLE